MRARLASLLARHMALEQIAWREALDRDQDGRPFFSPSHSPAAFAYAKDTVFCLVVNEAEARAGLAIDAEIINELPPVDIMNFLSKLYPSLRRRFRTSGTLLPAALWTAYESAYKLIGSRALQVDLFKNFPEDFSPAENTSFYLPQGDLHLRFLASESCMVSIASRETLPANLACNSLTRLYPPFSTPCQMAFSSHA